MNGSPKSSGIFKTSEAKLATTAFLPSLIMLLMGLGPMIWQFLTTGEVSEQLSELQQWLIEKGQIGTVGSGGLYGIARGLRKIGGNSDVL